jgi:two-component system, cell cycle response regulator
MLTPIMNPSTDLKAQTQERLRPRVLVAEDSAVYRALINSALGGVYDLSFVDDGDKAWQILQQPDAPKLVVLDWILPGLDGVDLCTRVRHQLSDHYSYLVLLTARDSEQDLLTAMEAGADDFVKKPFSAAELRARLKAGSRIIDLHDQLVAAATYDSLTRIRNRASIFALLDCELERCRREKRPLSLILADVDNFKSVNDTAGHLAGDQVLQAVATRITQSVRTYDGVGRYGGEEFLIGLPGSDLEIATARAEEIRIRINATPIHTDTADIQVSVSLGVTVVSPEHQCNLEDVLRRADEALYRAKTKGRNRVECTKP